MLFLTACPRAIGPVPGIAEREEGRERLQRFEQAWLEPAKVAPPTVSGEAQLVERDGLTAKIRLIRAEEAEWNEWNEGVRLFNERAGYFFDVQVAGEGKLTWLPNDTLLERNVEGSPLRAAGDPDDFLFPLQQAAIHSSMLVIDNDFSERARAAGPFRAAYMSRRVERDRMEGVIGFQADDTQRHVVAMRMTLAVRTEWGVRNLVVEWD
ncbi:MAG: hypothetical protein EP330_16475 [Deltaproteobacteria bacterium]|nr:MAG: hypothetical protein EP330_16475 [Deltaproteobacteria bacterium]